MRTINNHYYNNLTHFVVGPISTTLSFPLLELVGVTAVLSRHLIMPEPFRNGLCAITGYTVTLTFRLLCVVREWSPRLLDRWHSVVDHVIDKKQNLSVYNMFRAWYTCPCDFNIYLYCISIVLFFRLFFHHQIFNILFLGKTIL